MKRFDLVDAGRGNGLWREMKEATDGDWVPWEDAKPLEARVAELEEALDVLVYWHRQDGRVDESWWHHAEVLLGQRQPNPDEVTR